jgi:hypothetical protein
MTRLILVLGMVASLAAAACSASSSRGGAGAGGTDASTAGKDGGATSEAAAEDDAGGVDAAPCTEPVDARPEGSTCVLEATGTVEDLAGVRLPQLVMTMCSPAVCYGTRADDAGVYSVSIGDFLVTDTYAVHADGRPDHAVDYFRLGANEPQVISVDMRIPTLPPSTVLLPPDGAQASTVTVGDVTLQIADGTTFDLDIEDFGTDAGRTLRVAAVPLAQAPAYAAANQIEAIYALAPSGAKPSAKMGVSLRNAAGIPASAAVDVLVLSDDYFSSPPSVGQLEVQAAAHVSADGATIQTDPGEGISEITWLAVRRKGP